MSEAVCAVVKPTELTQQKGPGPAGATKFGVCRSFGTKPRARAPGSGVAAMADESSEEDESESGGESSGA